MIAAIVLHIVLNAQMTVPWIGGAAPTTPIATPYMPVILKPGTARILMPGQTLILFK